MIPMQLYLSRQIRFWYHLSDTTKGTNAYISIKLELQQKAANGRDAKNT